MGEEQSGGAVGEAVGYFLKCGNDRACAGNGDGRYRFCDKGFHTILGAKYQSTTSTDRALMPTI